MLEKDMASPSHRPLFSPHLCLIEPMGRDHQSSPGREKKPLESDSGEPWLMAMEVGSFGDTVVVDPVGLLKLLGLA